MNPETGMMNPKSLKVQPKPLTVAASSVRRDVEGKMLIEKKENVIPRTTMILDILWIPDKKYEVLLTSTNDKFVRGWKCTYVFYLIL